MDNFFALAGVAILAPAIAEVGVRAAVAGVADVATVAGVATVTVVAAAVASAAGLAGEVDVAYAVAGAVAAVAVAVLAAPAGLQPTRMSVEEALAPLRGRATEVNIANEEACTICMNALNINDEIITHKEKHFFHLGCMESWTEACLNGYREITCPVCKLPLASSE